MIKKNLVNTVNEQDSSSHKFRYFSAHDTTLNALLNAFELIDDNNDYWPPFAADIIIELWKDSNNEYFVQIFYCNKVNL